MDGPAGNRFSSLLLEGLDHYRRGRMLEAVRSWEEAYLLEPTNLRAREFLRSALERIHARMSANTGAAAPPGVAFQELQQFAPQVPLERLSGPGVAFRSFERHPWLRPPNQTAPGTLPAPPSEPDPRAEPDANVNAALQSAQAGARSSEQEQRQDERTQRRDSRPGKPRDSESSRSERDSSQGKPASAARALLPPPPEELVDDAPAIWVSNPGRNLTPPYDLGLELAGAAEALPAATGEKPRVKPASAPGAAAKSARTAPPAPPPATSTSTDGPHTPWDDGPSIALPQSDPPPERNDAVWKIHGGPLQRTQLSPDETAVWMVAAEELMALDDFSGALELASKVLARHPQHPRAQQIRATCEHNLLQMYESRLGGTARKPRVVLSPDEVIWLNLDPRAGFVLAQIDGQVSFEDLYAICGLTHLDTARILSQLLDEGVIEAVGELNHLF